MMDSSVLPSEMRSRPKLFALFATVLFAPSVFAPPAA
jgi:hypothetical protein